MGGGKSNQRAADSQNSGETLLVFSKLNISENIF
jgi:hypothetical protein